MVKEIIVSVNVLVVCVGVLVNFGDMVVVDEDGVVVVVCEEVDEVYEKVFKRVVNEEFKWMCLVNGEFGLDIYNMCECLVEKGLCYVIYEEYNSGNKVWKLFFVV